MPARLGRIDAATVLLDRAIDTRDGVVDEAAGNRMLGRVVGGAPGAGRGNRLGEEVCLRRDEALLDGGDCGSWRHWMCAGRLGGGYAWKKLLAMDRFPSLKLSGRENPENLEAPH